MPNQIEALFRYGHSSLCLRYFLPKQGTGLKPELRLLWQEKDKLLKLCVPTTLPDDSEYLGQTAFGRERLPHDGTEAVSQQWCALHAPRQKRTILCINDDVYGSNCEGGEIRLSLIRSPGYAMSDCNGKSARKPGRLTERMDQGERFYRFWFDFGGEELMASADRLALIQNEAPMALSMCPAGEGEPSRPVVMLEGDAVFSALKSARDGNGYLLRLYEPQGQSSKIRLDFPAVGGRLETELSPFEIKTFRLFPGSLMPAAAQITE